MNREKLEELLRPIIEEKELHLVDLDIRRHGRGELLQIFIDTPGGITMDDCAWVNSRLRERLELHDQNADYRLEISSPGLDRKLKGPAAAAAVIGRRVKAWTRVAIADTLEHSGCLRRVDAKEIELELGSGEMCSLPWDKITTVRLDPDLWGEEKEKSCLK